VNSRAPRADAPSICLPPRKRARIVAALILALLFQFVLSAAHSMMPTIPGDELCVTSSSMPSPSEPGTGDADAGKHLHDCCCTGNPSAPPSRPMDTPQVHLGVSGSAPATAAELAAQWLSPLSRGPPASLS
jgi:hypothetical protein